MRETSIALNFAALAHDVAYSFLSKTTLHNAPSIKNSLVSSKSHSYILIKTQALFFVSRSCEMKTKIRERIIHTVFFSVVPRGE